jgi:hypothetical protein
MTTDIYNYLITPPAIGFDATRGAALTALQTAIGTLATARLFPMVLDEGCALPAARYQLIDNSTGHNLEGGSDGLFAARVQIDIYSTDQAQTQTLADAVRVALDGYTDVMLGSTALNALMFDNELESFEDDRKLHVRTLDFMVFYN